MMEKIMTARDVAERYKCSLQCARNYMRKMTHMEKPLTVYESDLVEWEQSRMKCSIGCVRLIAPKIGKLVVPRKR